MPNRRTVLFLIMLAAATAAVPARAAQLLMFESAICEWCELWHEEIGPAYGKTRYGRIAPLRRIDIDSPVPQPYRAVRGVVFTPTFVLWHQGREAGRIVGYPGEDFFWPMLERLLRKLPDRTGRAAGRSGG